LLLHSLDSLRVPYGTVADRYSRLKICAIYAAVGTAWILFSDQLVGMLVADHQQLIKVNTYKGWLFILVTTLLLYVLIGQFMRQVLHANAQLSLAHEELEASYEELTATEEELRQQFEDLEKQTNALADSEWQYRSLFDNMLNAFGLSEIISDYEGKAVDYRFLSVNPAFERITGLPAAQVVGKTVQEVMVTTNAYWFKVYDEVVKTGRPWTQVLYIKELERYFDVASYRPGDNRVAVQFIDCTERIKHQEKIESLAYHDAVTGLPNRYSYQERLQEVIDQGTEQRMAVLRIDLADLKLVNHTRGRQAGDELLREMGGRLTRLLKQAGTVARSGGNEFMLLLEEAACDDKIIALTKEIIATVGEPWQYNEMTYRITSKVGIALFPDHGGEAQQLMQQADIAMYEAKRRNGEGYQFYVAEMENQIARRIELETELYQALDNEEFVVYYQPLVDPNGTIQGVEALVRWQHPTKGLIPPGEFIPVAEDSGLITGLGDWVLRTACRQCQEWQAAGLPPIFVSVNLSGRQFRQGDLVDKVARTVQEIGLRAEQVVLEITETVAMDDVDYTVTVLQSLKEQGIRIALDDFGMGYSSLIYLKRFPINALKIDRSFVRDIHTNAEGASIVKTILALAKSLNYGVVAEGVETEEQATFLKALDCDQMQGYLFSRPLPAAAMTELLRQRRD